MTLKAELSARIFANGPISVAAFMQESLLHPQFGYYAVRNPFGAAGDFTTSPEISQMFGEIIGLCLVQAWLDQGRPGAITLAELGPGRGTLMADILRVAAKVPDFSRAAEIVLVEASAHLRQVQQKTLAGQDITFIGTVDALPAKPLFFVANEFFDALPVRQFQRTSSGWRERQIGLEDDELIFGLGPQLPHPALHDRLEDTKDGDIVEYAPGAAPCIAALGSRITKHGGVGLVIDYGDWRSLGDTVQAVRSHQYADFLSEPGTSDLTAHVDFEALAAGSPSKHTRLTPQGVFLERLGITERANALAANLSGKALENHVKAHHRLTHPEEMGTLFKVLGFFPSGQAAPAGLDT